MVGRWNQPSQNTLLDTERGAERTGAQHVVTPACGPGTDGERLATSGHSS